MGVIDGAVIDEAVTLFPHYVEEGGVSPESVSGAADEIERPTGLLNEHDAELETTAQAAASNTSADLTTLVENAPKDAKDTISRVLATTLVASGSTRLFGRDGVAAYDGHVDDLRTEYRERKAEILASDCGVEEASYPEEVTRQERDDIDSDRDDLVQDARDEAIAALVTELQERQEEYREDPLDAQASTAAAYLEEGPTDQVLTDLFADGLLPSSIPDTFTDIEFRYEDPPSDLEDMDNGELAEYLQNHPELLDNDKTRDLVEERIEELSAEDGKADAFTVSNAANGVPTIDSYKDAMGNLALVSMYGTYAQTHDVAMPDNGAAYLTSFYDEVGGQDDGDDDAMVVATWLTDFVGQDWMTQAYADGLMVVSDADVHDDFGFQAVPQSVWDAIDDIPEKQVDKNFSIVGEYDTISLTGGEGFLAFADLMGHATAEPGLVMAGELTESTAELATLIAEGYNTTADMSAVDRSFSHTTYSGYEGALEEWGPLMQNVMDVASRNEEASEWLLTKANDDDFPEAREQLTTLYTFPWPDDGEAVSGYTDWIADARASGDPDRVELAEQASASFIDFLTDTGDPNTFKTLMQDATPDEMYSTDGQLSVGDVNPELVQSFGNVAGSNLDALGNDAPGHGTTRYEDDGTVSIALDDRSRLFTVIATDDDASTTLSQTIGAYEQTRLDTALASGDPALLQDVGAEASRLDGYQVAGLLNADLIGDHGEYQDAEAAYKEHLQAAAVGKMIISTGLGSIPDAGGIVSAGAGLVYDQILAQELTPPDTPDGVDVGDINSNDFMRTVTAYDFVAAQVRAGQDLPDQVEDMLDEKGNLPPIDELSSDQLSTLDNGLADDEAYLDYVEKHHGADPFKETAINQNGTHHKNEVEDYLNGN